MDEHRLVLDHGLVSLGGVLLGSVREEACDDALAHFHNVPTRGDYVHLIPIGQSECPKFCIRVCMHVCMYVPVHDGYQLLSNILSPPHGSSL